MSRFAKISFCAFIFYLIFLGTTFFILKDQWMVEGDGLGYYAHLRSIVIDGDLNYENEFRDFNPRNHTTQLHIQIPKTGKTANKYPVGPAILWAPFFLVAHGINYVVEAPLDGYSANYQFALLVASLFFGGIGVFFIYKTILLFYDSYTAIIASIGFCIASNTVYYIAILPSMAHTTAMFAVSGFVYYNLKSWRDPTRYSSYLLIGIFGGFVLLTRYQNIIFFILPTFLLLHNLNNKSITQKNKHIILKGYGVIGMLVLITIIPQLIAWKNIYGEYFLYSYGQEGFSYWSNPKLYATMLSARCGYMLWHPISLLGIIGLFYFGKQEKKITFLFVGLFLIQWYIFSAWDVWHLGSSFGYRGFISLSIIASVGLAALVDRFRGKKIAGFIVLLTGWNLFLMLQHATGWMPKEGPRNFTSWIERQGDFIEYIFSLVGM